MTDKKKNDILVVGEEDEGRIHMSYTAGDGTEVNVSSGMMMTLKKTVCRSLPTMEQLQIFLLKCRQMKIHPLSNLLHAFNSKEGGVQFITTIEFMRSVALKTKEYESLEQVRVYKVEDDGKEILVKATPEDPEPIGGKIYSIIGTMKRKGMEALTIETTWREFGSQKKIWSQMPVHMLKKTNAAMLFRELFSDVMGGLYTNEEMVAAKSTKAIDSDLPIQDEVLRDEVDTLFSEQGMNGAAVAMYLSDNFKKVNLNKLTNDELLKIKTDLSPTEAEANVLEEDSDCLEIDKPVEDPNQMSLLKEAEEGKEF